MLTILKSFDKNIITEYMVSGEHYEIVTEDTIIYEVEKSLSSKDIIRETRESNFGDKCLYAFVNTLDSVEQYENFLAYCRHIVTDVTKLRVALKEVALLLFCGVFEVDIEGNKSFENLCKSEVSRSAVFDIIETLFDCIVVDRAKKELNYKPEDMTNGITRAELMYILFRILPEELGIEYIVNLSKVKIMELIDCCYSNEGLNLKINIQESEIEDTIPNMVGYLQGYNFSSLIRLAKYNNAPVPYPLVMSYAEMINKELITEQMLGERLLKDIFEIETVETLSIILSKFIPVL